MNGWVKSEDKMGKKLNYDFLEEARYMPPLEHKTYSMLADTEGSKVCDFLCEIDAVRAKIFYMAKRKGIIVQREDGLWVGSDWDEDYDEFMSEYQDEEE